MLDISKLLINTYKPLNTLPGLIPRSFKLTCTGKHAHTWWPWGISLCPPTLAAACNLLMPQQVRACICGGLPCCCPLAGCWLLCLPCPRSGCCRVSPEVAHQVLTTAVSTSRSPPLLQIEMPLLFFLSSWFLLCFKSLFLIPWLLFTLVYGHLPL